MLHPKEGANHGRTGAESPDGPIKLENSPEWGLGGSAACGFFATGIPTSSYFLAASNGGLGCLI